MDLIRAEINAGHRFHSFATERSQNFVKWSVAQLHCGCQNRVQSLRVTGTLTAMTTCTRSLRCSRVPARPSSSWCVHRWNCDPPMQCRCATWGRRQSLSSRTSHFEFLQDWWLTPELYLRRPPAFNEQWRLDRVLKRKAEQGVKVYVVVYKEVSLEVLGPVSPDSRTMKLGHANDVHEL